MVTRREFLGLSLLGLAFGAAASGCARHGVSSTTVTVIDVTASTATAPVRKSYEAALDAVIESLPANTTFLAYAATQNTTATSYNQVRETIPAYDPTQENEDQYRERVETAFARIHAGTQSILAARQGGPWTDLLDAFDVASGVLSDPGVSPRLVVLSDMIHQTPDLDFLKEDLTPERIDGIIADLRREGRLPALPRVAVWIAGAGADPQGRINPAKAAQIRHFWLRFFPQCGAELKNNRYGTTLTNYN